MMILISLSGGLVLAGLTWLWGYQRGKQWSRSEALRLATKADTERFRRKAAEARLKQLRAEAAHIKQTKPKAIEMLRMQKELELTRAALGNSQRQNARLQKHITTTA